MKTSLLLYIQEKICSDPNWGNTRAGINGSQISISRVWKFLSLKVTKPLEKPDSVQRLNVKKTEFIVYDFTKNKIFHLFPSPTPISGSVSLVVYKNIKELGNTSQIQYPKFIYVSIISPVYKLRMSYCIKKI